MYLFHREKLRRQLLFNNISQILHAKKDYNKN